MKTEYRFRTNIFGKLILQIRTQYLYISEIHSSFNCLKWDFWRDAKIEDMNIEMLNLLKEK